MVAVKTPQLSIFLSLSCVLTGKRALDADLGAAYFNRARKNLGPKLETLLTRFNDLVTKGCDPIQAVREDIFPDPDNGAAARTVLLLWYTGGIRNGKDWEMQSADQYYRALVWEAIGAHPPTLSNGYFGHWKYPPEQ
jgi:D-sorbitol dehydrogenase-like protein